MKIYQSLIMPNYCFVCLFLKNLMAVFEYCMKQYATVNDKIFCIVYEYSIGSPDILCGNVTKFSMAKNRYAHRNLHTGIGLELNFYVSSSFNFRDFSV